MRETLLKLRTESNNTVRVRDIHKMLIFFSYFSTPAYIILKK